VERNDEKSTDWIDIEEHLEPHGSESDLFAAFERRYGAALHRTDWELRVFHAPGCRSAVEGGTCDCDAEVQILQPQVRRRIRLRWKTPPGGGGGSGIPPPGSGDRSPDR
jgi:hypothetical protein